MLPEKRHIRAVVKGCIDKGVHVSEELATVFYNSYILNSQISKNLQKKTSVSYSNERIVEQCINRLSVCKDPVILSIKMQLLLENNYKNREFIINKVNEENDQKIRPLVNAILDDVYTSGEESNIQYQRLIQYIILINYMGDPTSSTCIQETSSALNKVLNQNKLTDFENQLPSSKTKQLKEIANLVCGIMNTTDQRACKEEIFNMIDTLPKAIDLLLQNITQELEYCSKKIAAIILMILQCYKVDNDFLAPLFVIRTHLATIRYDELNEYKTVLVFYSQYKKNLKIIKKDLSTCHIKLSELVSNYNLKLKEIRHYLKDSNNFDEIIYPQLIDVSVIWNEMIEIMNYSSITTNLIVTMKQMAKEVNINVEYNTETSLTRLQTINDEEQQKIIESYPLHPMCQWYPPSTDGMNLFADGYCVVMIVETSGTLIKCDKTLSIIQYSDEWFGFSCIQAALHFGTKPSYYLNCFYNLVRSQVHLLFFFHLNDKIAERQYTKNELIRDKYDSTKFKYKDAQVQTILHPYDTNTIKYCQNTQEKEQLSEHLNIPNMSTRSAQTIDAYRSILVQTAPRDVGCNTMREKGTNTDQLESYLSTRCKYKIWTVFKNDVNS